MSRLGLLTASVLVVLVGVFPAAASAKGGSGGGHGHGGGGGGAICGSSGTSNCGFDVSYPQCESLSTLPAPTEFAIVGVNGGLANDYNPCLSTELPWASNSTGLTSQPKVSLYVNTADPGNMYNGKPIADWPTTSDPKVDQYGSCSTTTVRSRGHSYTVGENSDACAWQYGYDMAQGDISQLASVSGDSPATYPWWLDVETANSWQTDTTMNVADLEGMIQAFQDAGVPIGSVGVYSTSVQWSSIMGATLPSGSSLIGIPTWIPGATSYTGAQQACSPSPSFTGGRVALTQWTGTLDSDYVCPSA